jgi:hypothetical protein
MSTPRSYRICTTHSAFRPPCHSTSSLYTKDGCIFSIYSPLAEYIGIQRTAFTTHSYTSHTLRDHKLHSSYTVYPKQQPCIFSANSLALAPNQLPRPKVLRTCRPTFASSLLHAGALHATRTQRTVSGSVAAAQNTHSSTTVDGTLSGKSSVESAAAPSLGSGASRLRSSRPRRKSPLSTRPLSILRPVTTMVVSAGPAASPTAWAPPNFLTVVLVALTRPTRTPCSRWVRSTAIAATLMPLRPASK